MSTRSRLLPRLTRLTRVLPVPVWLGMRPLLGSLLYANPGTRRTVSQSMLAALGPDGFRQSHVRAYFAHVADLITFSAVIYREGKAPPALFQFWEHDEASKQIYQSAMSRGKGIVMAGAHVMGHELMCASVPPEWQITAFARKSPEPDYEALKQRWYASLGVQVVHRPPRNSPTGGLQEITSALRVLRGNRILAITPDLLERPGKGIPTTLFGREWHVPAGAFFMAMRSGAALLPTFAHMNQGKYRMMCLPEIVPDPDLSRDEAVAKMAREWSTGFEAFVRLNPDMWQFWLDKRWRRWLETPPASPSTASPQNSK